MKIRTSIDFGTSMTVMQTLDEAQYQAGSTDCRPIRFTQAQQASTPSLIRTDPTGRRDDCFGADARGLDWGTLWSNFKLLLRKDDAASREQATELVNRYFAYLYRCYTGERNKLYPNAWDPEEETVVGYPVQWSETERGIILEAAKKAGFQNVRGKDEAEASVICALIHCQQALRQQGMLNPGRPLNILVLDMGAGTTDLAFVSVSEENGKLKTALKGVWPERSHRDLFGGSSLDAALERYVAGWLAGCDLTVMGDAANVQKLLSDTRPQLKEWKEQRVSPALEKGLSVSSHYLDSLHLIPGLRLEPFPAIDRDSFETLAAEELTAFVRGVASAPPELLQQTELVILTGGNSQWYWVRDILTGKNARFDRVGLPLIVGRPERILTLPFSTEVVSRGLIYNPSCIQFRQPEQKQAPSDNIHERWRQKLEQGRYPDMSIMRRIGVFSGDGSSIYAVTDRGRVLAACNVKSRRIDVPNADIVEILSPNCFRTRGGSFVDATGAPVSPGTPPPAFIADPSIGIDRVKKLTWDGVYKQIGLCNDGSITFTSEKDLHSFISAFPAVQNNGNGTVGRDIVDCGCETNFFGTKSIFVRLCPDGVVEYCYKGTGLELMLAAGVRAIDVVSSLSSRYCCILMENGELRKYPISNQCKMDSASYTASEDCVAFASNGAYTIRVDSRGDVRFARMVLPGTEELRMRSIVHSWNLHDM